MNIMSALVGVNSLQVADVSDNVILVDDTVATEHVSGISGNLQGLSAVVALDHGDHLGSETALLVLQARHSQYRVETQSDLSAHVSHLLLHELGLSEGAPELLAVQSVLSCLVEAELCCSHCSPSDTESSLVEAAEGSLESSDIEDVVLGHLDVVHHDHAGDGGAEGVLALDLGSGDALHVAGQDESLDFPGFGLLGPDHENVRDG